MPTKKNAHQPDPEVIEFCRRIVAGELNMVVPVLVPERYSPTGFTQALRRHLPKGYKFSSDGKDKRKIWVRKLQ